MVTETPVFARLEEERRESEPRESERRESEPREPEPRGSEPRESERREPEPREPEPREEEWRPVTVTRPAERYGEPRPWARPLGIGVTALLAVVGLAWLVWVGLYHADPTVSARLRAFEVVDGSAVTATIDIERDSGVGVVCLLEAQASDHFVVGERRVAIPAGAQQSLTRTYRIPTERPATNAVLGGCEPAGR